MTVSLTRPARSWDFVKPEGGMMPVICSLKRKTQNIMRNKSVTLLNGLLLAALAVGTARSQTILSDNYGAVNVNSGFALGEGVNTDINPPTTRLTGTAAADLRYLQTAFGKDPSQYDINGNRLRVIKDTSSSIGRFTVSANGVNPFDFGPAMGSAYASPADSATYDIKISMRNDSTGTARFSFGIATAEGDVTTWDFGIQMARASGQNYYNIYKRIDDASSGVGDINAVMTTTAATTWQTLLPFLIRITDAGTETSAYNSRVQVSMDNGSTWIYDTSTDGSLLNGFRFDGPGRVIIFDQAGNTGGNVFYDSFSIVSTHAPPPPPERIWTGGGTDDNWSTADNWGGTPLTSGSPVVFDGVTRPINTNDLTDLTVASVTFSNGGFTLYGNAFTNNSAVNSLVGVNTFGDGFEWGSTGLKTWNIAAGSEVRLQNTTTVEVNGDHGLIGGGTLRQNGTVNIGQVTTANPAFVLYEGSHIVDGGSFVSRGGYRIGSQPTGTGARTVVTNGGTLAITATSGNLRVGDSANPLGATLDINNGTVNLADSVVLAVGYATGATGTVNQTGGLVSAGTVSFSQSGAGSGTYTIKNGTLSTRQIRKNNAAGLGTIYFDNAVLNTAAGANNALFFAGLDLAEIQSGGLKLDAVSDVSIDQVLSGAGPLLKSGGATATLKGANTYSGNTVVLDGTLLLPTTQTNTTTVQVGDGKGFGVFVKAPGTTLSVSSLSLTGASFGALVFDLGSFSTPTAPLMRTPSVSFSSPVTVTVANGVQLNVGQVVLVDYNGAIGGLGFAALQPPTLPSGVLGYLSNNLANTSIDLVITGVPGLRWTGATDAEWYGVNNWFDKQTSTATTYSDGPPIEFLDGATNNIINISAFPAPPVITVSNTVQAYTWSGGFITVPTLKKSGTGSLTRIDGAVDTITTIELNAGSFVADSAFDVTFATLLTDTSAGTGNFVKAGDGTMTLAAASSTYDGAVTVQGGTLKLANANSLGTTNGGTTIASGATLDLNDQIYPHEPVTVAGSGVSAQGAIIDATTGGSVANNLTDVTMTGDTTFGAPNGGRWDLRVRSSTGPDTGLKGNGFNLTKVGSGLVSIACQRNLGALTPYWEMNLGDILVSEGTLAFAEALSLGNPAKALTVNSGATLQFFDLGPTNPIVRNITITDARMNFDGGTTDTNVINGAINMTGAITVHLNQGVTVFNGSLTGPGSLNIFAAEPGRLYLNGANNFAGDTTVTNGTVGGTGSLTGNLVMLGGTNSPGMSLGTFTVGGNATLAGTTLMELDRNQSPNSDRLVVTGALNFGGMLQVVLGAGAPAPHGGDADQLFNKAGAGTFTAISLPALSGSLTWNTNDLAVNGSISVSGPPPPTIINSVYTSGNSLIFSGIGGVQGDPYVVVSSTNVALAMTNWTPLVTNSFGPGGTFNVTNNIDPSKKATFFRLSVPWE